jgi:hypothetical protein
MLNSTSMGKQLSLENRQVTASIARYSLLAIHYPVCDGIRSRYRLVRLHRPRVRIDHVS